MVIQAGVVMKTKFIGAGDKRFGKAIDYLDKEKSKRQNNLNQYYAFDDYSHSPDKLKNITALFNGRQDYLDESAKLELKKDFTEARENGSPMWQTVFSFDNDYLKELGLFRVGDHDFLDEGALKQATTLAMNKVINDLNLGATARWAAAIHYDTDNIHVHTMLVTTDPEATLEKMIYKEKEVYRGKIPPKTTRAMKSKFANAIADRDPTLARISYLMREQVVKQSMSVGFSKDIQIMRSITQLVNQLPKDRRLWKYGNNAMAPFRPQIDGLAQAIIARNNPKAMAELEQLLDEQDRFFKLTYGTGDGGAPLSYKENQLKQVNKDMGNALLKELVRSMSREEWFAQNRYTSEQIQAYLEEKKEPMVTKKTLNRITEAVEGSRQEYLSKRAYYQEQYRKDMQRKHELEQGRGY